MDRERERDERKEIQKTRIMRLCKSSHKYVSRKRRQEKWKEKEKEREREMK